MSGPNHQILRAKPRDIGGFAVRRVLPAWPTQMVGPFIFFDHMGPAALAPGNGLDVRPHPHIGLETVTYLFDGALTHRDSLGSVQDIRPGDINWMTAGSGIAHSERTPLALRANVARVHGIQVWVALPRAFEEAPPAFKHYPAATLPVIEHDGVTARVLAGSAFGASSPVHTLAQTLYVAIEMARGAHVAIAADYAERALYVAQGAVHIDDQPLETGELAVLAAGEVANVVADNTAKLMLLGGGPLDGERFIWWNFVSSSRERIEQAKGDWRDARFAAVPGETERIPLPE